MSSSSNATASSTKYTHLSQFTGQKSGTVYVCSRPVKGLLQFFNASGVHHFILVNVPDSDKWKVHEWLDTKDYVEGIYSNRRSYACESVKGYKCHELGTHTLDEVNNAVRYATSGSSYSSSKNCNDWCEQVASQLGWNLTVHWNCSCVAPWNARRIEDYC
eukprot:UN04595